MAKGKKKEDKKKEDKKKEDKKKEDKKKEDKKKEDKKKDGKKTEDSVCPPVSAEDTTVESSSVTLTDLQNDLVSEVEETQANSVIPDTEPEEVEEPPVQDVPRYREEPILAQVIVKSYEGEKVHDLYEGEGFACFEGGDTYKGMFSQGLMHGQGTYTWADGVMYEGTFVENVQMYNGCYTWTDGSIYEGEIKEGLRHGFGIFKSGTRPICYVGDWCKGKRHGKGIIYYDEELSSWYSGDWVNNVRGGWGIRCYKSGNIYEGQWESNVRHGYGRMRWLTVNQEYTGQWVYGIQHGYGTHTWFVERAPLSRYPLRNEYTGHFVQGQRHGHGKFIYAGGALYDGEWFCNKKHGKAKFVFKNGRVFEGEFVDDWPVETPPVDAEEQNAVGTESPSGTRKLMLSDWEYNSILGSDIELDVSSLLDLFPEEERQEELTQVQFAALRHISKLRRVYAFYSAISCDYSPDNTYCMTKFHFWRFLKDCQFHHSSLTLADMDRILRGTKPPEKIHCPHELLLFRTFLSYLVHLAFHMYREEHVCREKGPYLHNCFSEMMSRNIIPAGSLVQGVLFCDKRLTVFTMSYMSKCWEIFRAFCRPSTKPPFESTMTKRQFLWMLDDFKLLNKQLTASRIVEILVKDDPSPHGNSTTNLELEMVFLEFVEALLECAVVSVPRDMVKEQGAPENQISSSFEVKGVTEETTNVPPYKEDFPSQPQRPCEDGEIPCQQPLLISARELTDEAKQDKTDQDECSVWMCQVQTFLATQLFPAYQHRNVLREKMEEHRKQEAELAELRKIRDEELAKVIAEREAEEAKRREAAAAERALASKSAELQEPDTRAASSRKEKGHRTAPTQKKKEAQKAAASQKKKEAHKAVPAAGTKVPTGKKKNKSSGA